jgi:carboxypeptidase C (cathepsin A)
MRIWAVFCFFCSLTFAGCSSLVGMLTENGPLRVVAAEGNSPLNVSVIENGWSWNRFANVLYVDAPAGVGFSYSNTSSDYNTNNNRTAADNYAFLQGWLQKFPQFSQNPLYITGELGVFRNHHCLLCFFQIVHALDFSFWPFR